MVMAACSLWLVVFILLTFYVVVVAVVVDPVVESLDVSALVGEEMRLQETSLGEYLITTGALQSGSLQKKRKYYVKTHLVQFGIECSFFKMKFQTQLRHIWRKS